MHSPDLTEVSEEHAGFTAAQIADTCRESIDPALWSPAEQALLALADSLHASASLDDALWQRLAEHFSEQQLIECLLLVGFYHAVSFVVNGLRVEREEYAPRFPG